MRRCSTRLRDLPWFAAPPPKSTGRDLFGMDWLDARLAGSGPVAAADVQATLAALTATTIVDSVLAHAGAPDELVVCGGGAYNDDLLDRLRAAFGAAGHDVDVMPSSDPRAGAIAPEHVEALAFAWLAMRCVARRPGNLPAVTGAGGRACSAPSTPPDTDAGRCAGMRSGRP